MSGQAFAALELCDRAVRFVTERGSASDADLLTHVYGGSTPVAVRAQLLEPMLADARLQRDASGQWLLRGHADQVSAAAFTALALVTTGPTPGRARLVRITALHASNEQVLERFDAILDPQRRVPSYAAARAGLDAATLDGQPSFADVLDDLARFLAERPIVAQDAQLTWAFVAAEARQHVRALVQPALVDINDLASSVLQLKGKPTLAVIAAELGISTTQITRVDEEARVMAAAGSRLLAMGSLPTLQSAAAVLRQGATARALPDQPGVYVMRDAEQRPLYVGKARRLRSRMEAYVHRPIGATRRLEGLVGSVDAVDTTQCETDLEALVLEDREIRRLQPRFNTVRQQRTPRYWIRRPPEVGGKKLAPPRLELSLGPGTAEGDYLGPFRNEMLAEQARELARDVFELDALRASRSADYRSRLEEAWRFLHGETEVAIARARTRSVALVRRVVGFDLRAMLLQADPRQVRYAVIRSTSSGIEGFLLERGVFVDWQTLGDHADSHGFAQALLAAEQPRTTPDDVDVVLRWFAAQRPPAQLIFLPEDRLAAGDAIEDAVASLLARET